MPATIQSSQPGTNDSLLRALVDFRDRQVQKARIQFHNRLAALEMADTATVQVQEMLASYTNSLNDLETQVTHDISRIVRADYADIHRELTQVRGISDVLAAKLIALTDVSREETVSQLWSFAGLGVKDGKRLYAVPGQKRPWNGRLKTTMYLIGTSFLRVNSPYRRIYDDGREQYARTHPEWTKQHQHLAALRKMEKIFLVHFWERSRQLLGLPTRDPYVFEVLGHTTRYRAQEFGWPA